MAAILKALQEARETTGRPSVILARTLKGKGVASVEGKEGWHGKAFKKGEEADRAIAELEKQLVPGAETPAIPRPTEIRPRQAGARLQRSSPHPPTRRVTWSPRARRGAPRSRRLARSTSVSSRSTRTSRTPRSATGSRKAFADRFFEDFIAEQVMVGMSMGLAARGAVPFASTFACFLTRAADFIRMAGISAVNVKLTGSHAGISIGEDGPSQMALEDLAMMRAVPDCAVLYPCEAVSTERLVALMAQHKGMAYMRTSRPKTPVLYDASETFRIGGSKVVRQSNDDAVTIVGAGVTVFEALAAADQLQKEGISARVIDAYSRAAHRRGHAARGREGHTRRRDRRGSLRGRRPGRCGGRSACAAWRAGHEARRPGNSSHPVSPRSCSTATASQPGTSWRPSSNERPGRLRCSPQVIARPSLTDRAR